MPRVETPDIPEHREIRDLCRVCYREEAPKLDAEGWEVAVEHPPYEHHVYYCHECGQLLSKVDNIWNVPASIVPGEEAEMRQERRPKHMA